MTALGSKPSSGHRARPAVSLFLALAVGVLAVAGVRRVTDTGKRVEPESPAPPGATARPGEGALARRAFPAH